MVHDSAPQDKMLAALELAGELKWPVFPCWSVEDGRCACGDPKCSSPGKHPISKLVPSGLKNATCDLETVKAWWSQYPQANIAVRTGERLWALDLDGLHGIQAFAQIAEKYSDLAETPTARTGGGGRHIYFCPNDNVRNKARIGGAPIDVRGQDGYVLVPPSNHMSGNTYRWELPPSKYKLAQAPDWLIKYVTGAVNSSGQSTKLTFVCEGDLITHPGVKKGERNDVLCRLVGAHLAAHGLTNNLMSLAVAWGRRTPPLEEKQVTKTVTALAQKHVAQKAEAKAAPGNAILISYDTIDAQDVQWLWDTRIALGKLTIVSGDPGLGKTYMLLDVTARVSAGRDFPDHVPCKKAKVIFATVEDGPGDTIRPRLDLLGADVGNVLHFEGVRDGEGKILPFLLDQHVPVLDHYLDKHDDIRLMVVDPVRAFLGDVDSHKNAEVRAVLALLAKLAEKHNVAVVGINHLTKAQGKALYRSLGSLAFIAAARTAWVVVADPDDDERRLFLPVKNNLAKATGLAYRIIDGKIEWEKGAVLIAVDDLIDDSDTPRAEAIAWLENALANGPVEARELLKQAKLDGIAEKTLRRAKKELGVLSQQHGAGWSWLLPDEKHDKTNTSEVEEGQRDDGQCDGYVF